MSGAPPELPSACRLVSYDRLGSTNDEAKRLARTGAAAWTIVTAREQTAGRGRRGRSWIAIPGNLFMTVILRPDCTPQTAAQLGFVAALAVGEAVRAVVPAEVSVRFKWPNDVLLDGAKVSGILLESETTEWGALDWLIVGIGVNVVGHPTVGAYYYVRIVKLMYFDEAAAPFDTPIGRELQAVLVVTAVFVLFFFVVPGPLLTGAEAAASALFPG